MTYGIEGEFGVWEKAVPEVIREVGVSGSEGGDKVVLASFENPFQHFDCIIIVRWRGRIATFR
jgi:hypothetical protein